MTKKATILLRWITDLTSSVNALDGYTRIKLVSDLVIFLVLESPSLHRGNRPYPLVLRCHGGMSFAIAA